jgi:cytochrome c oxidase cbb3-type subunit 3
MAGTPEKDAISGQSTTGHEWDGIKELNTPLPKWWVYVFYICIVWAIGYWVIYPTWPTATGFTTGVIGYSSRAELETDLAAASAVHADKISGLAQLSVQDIAAKSDLANYARAGGAVLFKENCMPCHQSGGAGAFGYPTLADDSWIWGGTLDDIEYTVTNGIRSDLSADTRLSEMPRFGDMLETADITAVAQYVKGISEGRVEPGRGQDVFVEQCVACHSSDGANPVSDGNPMLGAPALGDKVWLYAAPGQTMSVEDIAAQVRNPKHSTMPAWGGRLKTSEIKMLTLYVHSLGGGQ